MRRFSIALLLSLALSILLSTMAGWLVPGIYGSCFEGSCGYLQAFIITPLATLVLLFPVSVVAKRLGAISELVLLFPLAYLFGLIIFEEVVGYGVPLLFLFLGYRQYSQNKAAGGKLRDLLFKTSVAAAPHPPK